MVTNDLTMSILMSVTAKESPRTVIASSLPTLAGICGVGGDVRETRVVFNNGELPLVTTGSGKSV